MSDRHSTIAAFARTRAAGGEAGRRAFGCGHTKGMTMQESEDRQLLAALRAMAGEDAETGASTAVEGRLLAEVRSIATARRRRNAVAALAIAAALLVALAVPVWRTFTSPPAVARAEEVTTEFLPLLYSGVPATHVQTVRLAVPRAALASFGLTPLEALDRASTDTVLADVLVGDDGLARAVRFVRPAADQEQMP